MRAILAGLIPITVAFLAFAPPADGPRRAQDAAPGPPDPLKHAAYAVYARHCAPCHGERGDGGGVAARFLDPPPRDFKREAFKMVSTANGTPSSKDLFETIATGVGGTAMIPFASLGEDVVWDLVDLIDEFRVQGLWIRLREAGLADPAIEEEVRKRRPQARDDEIAEPAPTMDGVARGLVHYRALCASCHGVDGRGIMPESTPPGVRPTRPRDLGRGVMKQIPTARNLFARIRCGMPGTAMASVLATTLDGPATWDLVHYVRTLIPEGAQLLASVDPKTLAAPRLEGAPPDSPDDPRFDASPREWIAFAPFRDSSPGPPGAFVQTLAGDGMIAFRFTVPDPTSDVPGPDHDRGPDGIAVRVTATQKPPVLPFPGQVPKIDRAVFLTGPLPNDRPLLRADGTTGRFENPEGVCRMVIGPDRAGSGFHRQGAWHVTLTVRTVESESPLGETPLWVSFAPFDGSARSGPMPVGYSAWHRLAVR